MNTIISPSLLACDFLNLESELNSLKGDRHLWLHLDIMDSHFVPNLTFGAPLVKKISKRTKLPIDVHLMVSNPRFHMDEMKKIGVYNITFHIEASTEASTLISDMKNDFPSIGISLKPSTPISEITHDILSQVNLLLIMSVEPGFGGQSFIEKTFERVSYFNKLRLENNYSYQIQIDGGVTNLNSKKLRDLGADNLVAGSYIFKHDAQDYLDAINKMRSSNG